MSSGKKIRNAIITAISVLGVSFIYRKSKKRPLVRVLCFHDVTDLVWFKNLVAYMDERHHIISPEDFVAARFDTKKINVLITFDDGYASWVDVALPVLNERNKKAIFFVNSGLIEVSHDMEAQKKFVSDNLLLSTPRKTLSWNDVSQLHAEGYTIGGHSEGHKRLSELGDEALSADIEGDKKCIEENVGTNIIMFAYPFGRTSDYTERTQRVVGEAGYEYAFTTESRFFDKSERGLLAVPRLCIEEGLSLSQVDKWINGGYDVFAQIKRVCAE